MKCRTFTAYVSSLSRARFESELFPSRKYRTIADTKRFGYLPVIQPFFIEHDKLMVFDHWYVIGFESDLLSVIKYRAIIYAQFTSYLSIVHAFFV